MNRKKNTPLAVLKAIEPFIDKDGENFISADPENDILRIKDIDVNSDFYFHVEKYEQRSNQHQILINYKPHTEHNVEPKRTWISVTKTTNFFTIWVNLLKGYEKVKSPFDDPIAETFKEDYFTEFELIDEEYKKPLKPAQILFLDEYFEKVEDKIIEHKNESNSEQIKVILEEIHELRDNLSIKAKFWIINQICWIWAKMTKIGPKIMKDFVDEGNKRLVKESVTQIYNYGKDLLM